MPPALSSRSTRRPARSARLVPCPRRNAPRSTLRSKTHPRSHRARLRSHRRRPRSRRGLATARRPSLTTPSARPCHAWTPPSSTAPTLRPHHPPMTQAPRVTPLGILPRPPRTLLGTSKIHGLLRTSRVSVRCSSPRFTPLWIFPGLCARPSTMTRRSAFQRRAAHLRLARHASRPPRFTPIFIAKNEF